MNTCKTCAHWKEPDNNSSWREDGLLQKWNPETEQVEGPDGYEVRLCKHPDQTFFDFPKRNGFGLVDGSEYMAAMGTGEDFGCVMHEEAE